MPNKAALIQFFKQFVAVDQVVVLLDLIRHALQALNLREDSLSLQCLLQRKRLSLQLNGIPVFSYQKTKETADLQFLLLKQDLEILTTVDDFQGLDLSWAKGALGLGKILATEDNLLQPLLLKRWLIAMQFLLQQTKPQSISSLHQPWLYPVVMDLLQRKSFLAALNQESKYFSLLPKLIAEALAKPSMQAILQEKDFYFAKGQQALNQLQEIALTTEDLSLFLSDYLNYKGRYDDFVLTTDKIKLICERKHMIKGTRQLETSNCEIENNCRSQLLSITSLFNNSENLNNKMENVI